jgi:3-keto-L-gulonate-6-phosphate decarboxylase
VYAGRHAVAYLESLGFDTLKDIVNHSYDVMMENKTAAYGDKLVEYIFAGADTFTKLSAMDRTELRHRCLTASRQNQKVLKDMSARWPAEFAAWLPAVIDHIK